MADVGGSSEKLELEPAIARLDALESRLDRAGILSLNGTRVVSGVALVLSIISTLVSVANNYQARVHEAQRELRELIIAMNNAIRLNMVEQRDTNIPATERETRSQIINIENKTHVADAVRIVKFLTGAVTERIGAFGGGANVSSPELINLAYSMRQSQLYSDALEIYRLSHRYARNGQELSQSHAAAAELIAYTNAAGNDAEAKREQWRAEYRMSLDAFKTFTDDHPSIQNFQRAYAEYSWGYTEDVTGNCRDGRQHLQEAERWINSGGALQTPGGAALAAKIATTQTTLKGKC